MRHPRFISCTAYWARTLYLTVAGLSLSWISIFHRPLSVAADRSVSIRTIRVAEDINRLPACELIHRTAISGCGYYLHAGSIYFTIFENVIIQGLHVLVVPLDWLNCGQSSPILIWYLTRHFRGDKPGANDIIFSQRGRQLVTWRLSGSTGALWYEGVVILRDCYSGDSSLFTFSCFQMSHFVVGKQGTSSDTVCVVYHRQTLVRQSQERLYISHTVMIITSRGRHPFSGYKPTVVIRYAQAFLCRLSLKTQWFPIIGNQYIFTGPPQPRKHILPTTTTVVGSKYYRHSSRSKMWHFLWYRRRSWQHSGWCSGAAIFSVAYPLR